MADEIQEELETERERHLHAMYDALRDLDAEAAHHPEFPPFAGVARAILRGQLKAAGYPQYLLLTERASDAADR